jgi:hypothetical protein
LIVEDYGPEIVCLPGVHKIVSDFLSHHPISMDSINEIHCIAKIVPIDDNDTFPLDFVTISTHQQADAHLQQIKQSTITMRLKSLLVALQSSTFTKNCCPSISSEADC